MCSQPCCDRCNLPTPVPSEGKRGRLLDQHSRRPHFVWKFPKNLNSQLGIAYSLHRTPQNTKGRVRKRSWTTCPDFSLPLWTSILKFGWSSLFISLFQGFLCTPFLYLSLLHALLPALFALCSLSLRLPYVGSLNISFLSRSLQITVSLSFFLLIFIYLAAAGLSCSTWDFHLVHVNF